MIDDFSRVVCHCEAYPEESLPSLEDCLKKAMLKFGIPKRVYTDRGAVYSGTRFALICADLGIHPIPTTGYTPWKHGRIERLWGVQEDAWSSAATRGVLPPLCEGTVEGPLVASRAPSPPPAPSPGRRPRPSAGSRPWNSASRTISAPTSTSSDSRPPGRNAEMTDRSSFNLLRSPFSPEIEHHALFASDGYRQCHARLDFLRRERGLAAVVGDFGSGKTSCLRGFLNQLAPSSHHVLYAAVSNGGTSIRPVVEGWL